MFMRICSSALITVFPKVRLNSIQTLVARKDDGWFWLQSLLCAWDLAMDSTIGKKSQTQFWQFSKKGCAKRDKHSQKNKRKMLLYNNSILTLVNRLRLKIKLFLDSSELAQGQVLFFVFFFLQKNSKISWLLCPDIHTWSDTHSHTYTNRGTNPSGLPACLLPLLRLIRRPFFICRTQRNGWGPM